MPDRVGQQLGNYRLTRLLGRGGFADVYLGEHLYLKNRAALKVLRTSLADEDVEHFLAESQTLARLAHPNIVRVLDFAVEQGIPFLVMEYAPRGTMRQHHPRGSCLSLETTTAYVKQAAAALQYAHKHNVIHRDIKPENILLASHQQVLLSDFGLALFSPVPELLSTQEMSGTLPYMAPEQIRGRPRFTSDQYSLGIVVYEWLCGVRPFEGSAWQIINQHLSASPPPLREKDPSLPKAVEEVVLKALAKDPEQRYVSMQRFAQALEQASQQDEHAPIIDARQDRYEKALAEIMAYLERELPDDSSDESYPTGPIGEPRNPYKGLRAFTGDDATDFFGRDTLIAELIGKVKDMLTPEQPGMHAARMLAVLGPSGSGKSSA